MTFPVPPGGGRMLRLVGRKADGWLPSLPYLKPGDLRRGNQLIDEAATAAGRDPREVTRLLNVTPQESADDLVSLALEEGIGTFIVTGDDRRALRHFATEVVPAVRERVAAARVAAGVKLSGMAMPLRIRLRQNRHSGQRAVPSETPL